MVMNPENAEDPFEPHKILQVVPQRVLAMESGRSGVQGKEISLDGSPDTKPNEPLLQPFVTTDSMIPLAVLSEMGKGGLRRFLLKHFPDLQHSNQLLNIWHNLLATAKSSSVTDRHLTATCNVLSIFIQNAFPDFKSHGNALGSSKDAWFDCFEVVCRTFGKGNTKPALQVLDALLQAYRDLPDRGMADKILDQAVYAMLMIVILGEPQSRTKEALVLLTRLLRGACDSFSRLPKLVSTILIGNRSVWIRRLNEHGIDPADSLKLVDSEIGSLTLSLFLARNMKETRNAAVKLFSSVVQLSLIDSNFQKLPDIGLAMEAYISCSLVNLDEFASDIFPTFFTDARQFDAYIMTYKTPMANSRLALFLATVQVGRMRDYIQETGLCSLGSRMAIAHLFRFTFNARKDPSRLP
jgi:hypothetical protein